MSKINKDKDRVAAKLKKIRIGYRKACDLGRKSGSCRIVFSFYGLCENLCGGSSEVTSLYNATDSPLQDQLSSTTFLDKFLYYLCPALPAFFEEDEKEVPNLKK